jgi:hypothetical protein
MAHRLIFILSFFAIVLVSSLLYFFYLILKSHRKWKADIKSNPKDRMVKNKQDFIDFYLNLGYEEKSIDFVYSRVQKTLRAQDLVLLQTDDIVNLYERGEEEWMHILNRWLKELGYAELSAVTFKNRVSKPLNFEFLIRTIQLRGII